MKFPIHPLSVYLAAIGLAVGQVLYYFPLLPDTLASHFGPNGTADGWMGKAAFMTFYLTLLLVVAAVLAGVGLLMTKLPVDMINLPNREYWLAPERRARTQGILQERMTWFGAATLIFLIAMMQLTFLANLGAEPRLDNRAMIATIGYLVFTMFRTIGLIASFSRVPDR
ncbi:MAG: DUF1648 domain-containing protein [Capsulimonadales bacterium]|nr:DUF1648 domain-containing protein [Capsulimonadales bacterium]